MDPQTQQYLLIGGGVLAAILVVALIVMLVRRRRERNELRQRFGPEYDRTVEASGSKRAAVRDLREREALRGDLDVRELTEGDRDLVRRHMAELQYRFVEDPADVMMAAGRVATEVLRAKGYPVDADRDTGLRLFSVDYPSHAGDVRTAMEGSYRGDVRSMRDTFVGLRRALDDVAGITYELHDAMDTPQTALPAPPPPPAPADELRVEHDMEPQPADGRVS